MVARGLIKSLGPLTFRLCFAGLSLEVSPTNALLAFSLGMVELRYSFMQQSSITTYAGV